MVGPGDVLTVAQARRILPLPRSTFYELIRAGVLPHVRVPGAVGCRGRVLVLRADLEAFIERSRHGATRAPTRVDADALLQRVRRRRE